MNIVRRSSFRATPWKNGGGTTFEALRVPAEPEPFRWRVSVAEVASSGPFSDFTGYQRHMVLLSGAGVRLTFAGGGTTALRAVGEGVAFDGAVATQCELLAGPCTDFNLIAADGIDCVAAGVRSLERPLPWADPGCEIQLAFAVAGGVELVDAAGATAQLGPWDLAWRGRGTADIVGLAPIPPTGAAMIFMAGLNDV